MRSCTDATYAAGYSDALTDMRRLAALGETDINDMIDTLRAVQGPVPVRVTHRLNLRRSRMRVSGG